MCETVCPHAVFSVVDGKTAIARKDACMECGACMRNCEAEALFVQAGVGCANAVINAAIGRSGACSCDCQC
jgi:ferredoxin